MTDTKQEPSPGALAEAAARKREPLRVLPASWFARGVAEGMAEWLKRNPHAVTFRPPIDKRTRPVKRSRSRKGGAR